MFKVAERKAKPQMAYHNVDGSLLLCEQPFCIVFHNGIKLFWLQPLPIQLLRQLPAPLQKVTPPVWCEKGGWHHQRRVGQRQRQVDTVNVHCVLLELWSCIAIDLSERSALVLKSKVSSRCRWHHRCFMCNHCAYWPGKVHWGKIYLPGAHQAHEVSQG